MKLYYKVVEKLCSFYLTRDLIRPVPLYEEVKERLIHAFSDLQLSFFPVSNRHEASHVPKHCNYRWHVNDPRISTSDTERVTALDQRTAVQEHPGNKTVPVSYPAIQG